jgi:hypothetical protein
VPKEQILVRLFEKVRDIPYGTTGSRDPEQVYLKNMGTCSGKHFLLYELLIALGFEVKQFVCSHKFKSFTVKFPQKLQELLNCDFLDYHNFLKVMINGKLLIMDATWDLPLKKYGFPVKEKWDGKTDTMLGVVPIQSWETKDPEKFKEDKIGQMPQAEQEARKIFIRELSAWTATLR